MRALNSRPLIRLAERRAGGIAYPRRKARRADAYADTPPPQPAAIHVYDQHGYTTVLPWDLDAHDRTPEQAAAVTRDLAAARELLAECGLTYVADQAHCGVHIYVLLEDAISANEARTLVDALARRLPTLDKAPTSNASDGLITIPGSIHRLGGTRELVGDPAAALASLDGPGSPASALRQLHVALADEIRANAHQDAERGADARERARSAGESNTLAATIPSEDIQAIIVRGIGRHMSAKCSTLATTGDWRAAGYPSASEARRAVLMSAIATGFDEAKVRQLMANGTWPGLHSLFDHKGLHRLRDEYQRAAEEITRRERSKTTTTPLTRDDTPVVSDTSATAHSGAGGDTPSAYDAYARIRAWITLVERYAAAEYQGPTGWNSQMALRSLGKAASMVGSTVTAMGTRWHAIAQGDSRTDAAAILTRLAAEPDPWVTLVARGRGIYADSYQLRIPDRHAHLPEQLRWRAGTTHAVRPVFTVLGKPAGLFYEAIERGATSRARIALVTGLRDDAYRDARDTALAYGLVTGNDREGYELAADDGDLERLAERLGAIDTRTRRIHQFARERRAYWRVLATLRRTRPWIRCIREIRDTDPEVEDLLALMRAEDPEDRYTTTVA